MKEKMFENRKEIIFSIIMSIVFVYGKHVVDNENRFFVLLIYGILSLIIYTLLSILFDSVTNSLCSINIDYLNKLIEKIDYKKLFFLIAIIWLPHLIIKYPVGSCYDTLYQLEQGLGLKELTTHHPVFHTMLLTSFYKLGMLFGNANIGMFLYSIIQTVVMDLVFSFSIITLRDIKANNNLIFLATMFFLLNPYVTGFIGVSVKDVYYSIFCVLLVTIFIRYIYYKKENFWNIKNIILLFVSSFFVFIFRKNGIFFLLSVLIPWAIKEKKKIIVFVACIIIPFIFQKTLVNVYNAKEASIAEALSLPFQQTARMSKYSDSIVTEDDKEVINVILPYEELKNLYDERSSDPVKDKFKEDSNLGNLANYFVIWVKNFFKDPIDYVEATARQNIYLVYNGYNNFKYYIDCNADLMSNQELGLLQTPLSIKSKQGAYDSVMTKLHYIPVLQLLNNMSVYIVILFLIFIKCIKNNDKCLLLLFLPLFISLLVTIAGPLTYRQPRYVLMIIWLFPIVSTTVLSKMRSEKHIL